MKLLHDYLLVKEVIQDSKLEGTKLNLKYDDSDRFMLVEIVEVSKMLWAEYSKFYPALAEHPEELRLILNKYRPGTQLVINRVAKTPYKDGLYFISFKDIIAIESYEEPKVEHVAEGQMTIYDYN